MRLEAFTLSNSGQAPKEAARNLAAFVHGYGADQDAARGQLPAVMHRRAAAMHELLRSSHYSGREPWGSMYVDGHGAHLASCDPVRRAQPGPLVGTSLSPAR